MPPRPQHGRRQVRSGGNAPEKAPPQVGAAHERGASGDSRPERRRHQREKHVWQLGWRMHGVCGRSRVGCVAQRLVLARRRPKRIARRPKLVPRKQAQPVVAGIALEALDPGAQRRRVRRQRRSGVCLARQPQRRDRPRRCRGALGRAARRGHGPRGRRSLRRRRRRRRRLCTAAGARRQHRSPLAAPMARRLRAWRRSHRPRLGRERDATYLRRELRLD